MDINSELLFQTHHAFFTIFSHVLLITHLSHKILFFFFTICFCHLVCRVASRSPSCFILGGTDPGWVPPGLRSQHLTAPLGCSAEGWVKQQTTIGKSMTETEHSNLLCCLRWNTTACLAEWPVLHNALLSSAPTNGGHHIHLAYQVTASCSHSSELLLNECSWMTH